MSRPQPPADFAPPRFADPRRIGALVGLVGAVVFVWSSSPQVDDAAATTVRVVVVALVVAALVLLFALPRWLGRFEVPSGAAIAVYLACVVGEVALIRVGSAALGDSGHASARPALIAAVVGLHFVPFAWAFRERMFTWLGTALLLLGVAGLGGELAGVDGAAPWAAVLSGLAMACLVTAYAAGAFARPRAGVVPAGRLAP